MNVSLLRKVKKQILAEPRQVVMEGWFATRDGMPHLYVPKKIPNCGTAGCIGGWAISIKRQENPAKAKLFAENEYFDEEYNAAKTLKLTEPQGKRLFFLAYWPYDFRCAYDSTQPQTKERARVIAKRIDAFIKSKGKT